MCAKKLNLAEIAEAIAAKAPAAPADTAPAPADSAAAVATGDHAKIRAARKAVGLPQVSFARLLHTPIAQLNDWELGRQTPPGVAVRLCELLIKDPDLIKQFD